MESSRRRPEQGGSGKVKLPEIPTEPLEFLARSWSPSALQLCKALSLSPRPPPPPRSSTPVTNGSNMNVATTTTTSHVINGGGGGGENEESSTVAGAVVNNSTNNGDPPQPSFSFASSSAAATTTSSQLVLERIMSQSVREHESILHPGQHTTHTYIHILIYLYL